MKALVEMVNLISRHKKKQIEVLGQGNEPGNRYEEFYELIADGVINNDEEAASHFFGPDASGTYPQYRNLRNSMFKRLVNSFFFIDLKKPQFSTAQSAQHNVRKNTAAARMLASKGAAHSAFEIAENSIKAAVKYEMVYEIIDLAKLLRYKYASTHPDRNRWSYYDELTKMNIESLKYIDKAERYFLDLMFPYTQSKASRPDIEKKGNGQNKSYCRGCKAFFPAPGQIPE